MHNLHELWVEFGKEKNLIYIAVLSFFHTLSGCDTTSSIFGKSKKTFYDAWILFPEITKVFMKLTSVQ